VACRHAPVDLLFIILRLIVFASAAAAAAVSGSYGSCRLRSGSGL